MEFETKHLIIKKFIPEYISIMFETWGTDREVGKYMPGFKTEWDIDGFSDYILKTYKDAYHTRAVIQEKKSNEIIGNISLYQEDSVSKSVTIWLVKDYWNNGYGSEVLAGIIKYLKKNDKTLESLYATTDKRNVGANTMLENNNFELIDEIPDYRFDLDGNIGTELLYELEMRKVK